MLTIIKGILFFLLWALLVGFIPIYESNNPALWRFFAELTPFVITSALTIIFYFIEKKKYQILVISNIKQGIILGIFSGVLWLGLTTLVFLLTGVVEIIQINEVDMLWLWIVSALLNVIMQELLVRGYLYQLIKHNYSIVSAVVITTLSFTLMHTGAITAGAIPTLNVITMSLFMSILLEYSKSIVAPIIAHAFWNIVGAIILGSVTLATDYPNMVDLNFKGNILLSGGDYMFEGSLIVLIINIGFILYFSKKYIGRDKA